MVRCRAMLVHRWPRSTVSSWRRDVVMEELQVLVTGRGLVEAPRWHEGRLYFSDWTAGEVIAVDSARHTEVVARVRSLPLCTAWLPDGRLLIVSSADGLLLRRGPGGAPVAPTPPGGTGRK